MAAESENLTNHPPSYDAILKAAIEEYVLNGRAGVRMEAVAERAGVNKTLVYRHFGDRDGLFKKALEAVFEDRFSLLDRLPMDVSKLFDLWTKRFASDTTFLRMLMREALEHGESEPVHKEIRAQYYKEQVKQIEQIQEDGELPGEIKASHLFLMLSAILAFPFLLPQITELLTGLKPSSKAFQRDWKESYKELIKCLKE